MCVCGDRLLRRCPITAVDATAVEAKAVDASAVIRPKGGRYGGEGRVDATAVFHNRVDGTAEHFKLPWTVRRCQAV